MSAAGFWFLSNVFISTPEWIIKRKQPHRGWFSPQYNLHSYVFHSWRKRRSIYIFQEPLSWRLNSSRSVPEKLYWFYFTQILLCFHRNSVQQSWKFNYAKRKCLNVWPWILLWRYSVIWVQWGIWVKRTWHYHLLWTWLDTSTGTLLYQ